MKIDNVVWHAEDGWHRYDVDIVIMSGNHQILFTSKFIGTLALCTRTELDIKKGVVKYHVEYGNSMVHSATEFTSDRLLVEVKKWLTKHLLDGDYIRRIEFSEEYAELDRRQLDFTLN